DAEVLKKVTDGKINMFKTGSNSQTALHLFFKMCPFISEPITLDESMWIRDSTVGAIIFANPYQGPVWKYDICSMYPSILQDNHMLYPFREGVFETISNFDKDYHTAIYRCTIGKKPGMEKLFRYNIHNKYTSIDVRRARELKLDIKLIVDGKPNVLIWDRSRCKTGAQIFRPFVKYMFELKEKKVARAKGILNSLWGALTQQVILKKAVSLKDGFPKDDNLSLLKMTPFGDDKMILE